MLVENNVALQPYNSFGIVARALRMPDVCEIPFSEKVLFHSYAATSDHLPVSFLATRFTECVKQVFDELTASPAVARKRARSGSR